MIGSRECLALLMGALLIAVAGLQSAYARLITVNSAIDAELNYLLSLVKQDAGAIASVPAERLTRILEFIDRSKEPGAIYVARDRQGAPSAYLETDLRRPFGDTLQMTYDIRLPAVLTSPSTVRTARWESVDPGSGRLPPFWEYARDGRRSFAATGVEHLVNSPDEHTGAYYEYDLDRVLLLTRWRNRPVFVSLSEQKARSTVGRQGVILGDDDRWMYLYSGLPGLNWPGMGWVDSYLYDSCSVAFYVSGANGPATTRFAIFKWIKAGWVGLNVANSQHIEDGLRRYARDLKVIMEHPGTANIDRLITEFSSIQKLPRHRLTGLTVAYLNRLRATVAASSALDGRAKAMSLLDRPGYIDTFGIDEMISAISLERLKALLGRPDQLPFDTHSVH